jgi:hypothetical protein
VTETLTGSPSNPASRCYAWPLTVARGSDLRLHVSTTHDRFAVQLFRCGASIEAVATPERVYTGVDVPFGRPDEAWGWPEYEVALPDDLVDGIYVAVPVPVAGSGPEGSVPADTSLLTRRDACLFVRARARPGTEVVGVLYKLPTATYSAYNQLGGVSLYAGAHWTQDWTGKGYVVSLQRPGNGGVGGRVMETDAPDPYARTSRRQVFAHWDYPLIAWLESQGYAPSYCTDFDLDADEQLLDGVTLLMSAGHDEYWSAPMRRRVLEFVDRGGNVAFFTGDTAGLEIEVAASGDRLLCAKIQGSDLDNASVPLWGARWHSKDPGDWLTLTDATWGGGWWDGRRAIDGYQPVIGGHWAFEGVTFPDGGITGGVETPIVGYETDGVALRDVDAPQMQAAPRGGAGGRVLLAVAKLSAGWVTGYSMANAAMVLRTARSGGMVFICGMTDWSLGVAADAQVRRITENVVSRLARPSLIIRGPIYAPDEEISEGEVVGDELVVEWYVDGSQVAALGLGTPEWTVAGGIVVDRGVDGVLSTRAVGTEGWLTVTARCRDARGIEHFGSRTVQVVRREQYLQRRIVRVLHAMANPDEQGGALVDQRTPEVELASRVIPIRFQWVKRHAATLDVLMSELESMWRDNGRMAEASLREEEM